MEPICWRTNVIKNHTVLQRLRSDLRSRQGRNLFDDLLRIKADLQGNDENGRAGEEHANRYPVKPAVSPPDNGSFLQRKRMSE